MSPRKSVSEMLEKVGGWKRALILTISLLSAGAVSADTYHKFSGVPERLVEHSRLMIRHDSVTNNRFDSLLVEMRRTRRVEEMRLCIEVAGLRHRDWASCLFKEQP